MIGPWILSLLVKVTLVLAIGLCALRLSTSARAAIRHACVAGLFAIAAALPIGAGLMPSLDVPIQVSCSSSRRSGGLPNPSP